MNKKPYSNHCKAFLLSFKSADLSNIPKLLTGRRERIRTSDPLVPNQLRYQAALLAENEAHLTALVVGRQYLFDNHGLVADKNSMNAALSHGFHRNTSIR